jgi:hypothetical protein
MSTSTDADLCWRPRLPVKAAAMAAWLSSPCRISPRRCGGVRGLVDRVDTQQRRQLVFPSDGDTHKRWTYLPGQRPGLRLGDLSEEQLEPALHLLQLLHSVRGWSDIADDPDRGCPVRAVARQTGRGGVDPDRDLPYWLVVLGGTALRADAVRKSPARGHEHRQRGR